MKCRVIAKQRAKRIQTHCVYLCAVEKYNKVESVNAQNNQETRKQVQDRSNEFLGNNNDNNNKKDFLEKPMVTMIMTL